MRGPARARDARARVRKSCAIVSLIKSNFLYFELNVNQKLRRKDFAKLRLNEIFEDKIKLDWKEWNHELEGLVRPKLIRQMFQMANKDGFVRVLRMKRMFHDDDNMNQVLMQFKAQLETSYLQRRWVN